MAATNSLHPARRRWYRRLFWIGGGLAALLLLAAGTGVLWLRSAAQSALPQLDGNVRLAGLAGPVTVRRDTHGVPHIEAATQDDLFAAQGYVTAQDRLWQMDAFRRNANGELAEVMGPALIKHDRLERVLQMRRTAERIYARLPAADRARLDDYARGVNLYIEQCERTGTLPVEFRLLGYRPRPWTGADSVSVGLMEVQELDGHAGAKLERERIAARLNNPDLVKDLYPVGSWRDHPPTGIPPRMGPAQPLPPPTTEEEDEDNDIERTALPRGPLNEVDDAALAQLGTAVCPGCAVGSNNWVVSGEHTASGRPLLANDMHLRLTVPNIWYIAGLRAPGYHAAGVTLPGMPYIIAGHNEHVAWGFTALYADVQDLYLEKLDGHGHYEGLDAKWHPLAVDREVIHVRGGRDVVVQVQSTEHGPLMNPILPGESRDLALKWTLYDPNLNALPLYAMNVAANWKEFSAALAEWCWPTQNLVYADDQGHIAYHAIGKVPIRRGGMGVFDLPIPHDAQTPRDEWGVDSEPRSGKLYKSRLLYIPFDAMPHSVDPPSGFLATANSRVTTDKSPFPLTDEWIDPYRIERIYNALDGRDNLTPQDMLAMQTDIYSEVDQEIGQRLAYAIDHTRSADARLRRAAALLRTWDGRLTTGSVAASIVTQARAALWPLILAPRLGKLAGDYHWGESNFAEEEILMHARPEWLPPGYRDWNALLTEAVRRGMENGAAPANVSLWRYGNWHVVDLEHPLAVFLPMIGRIAGTGPQPMSGDTTTVKQVSPSIGPSQRFTMDWSDVDGSTENIVLGESGNPLSPYFRDQWKDWYGGATFALPFSAQAVAGQTRHTLHLLP